MYWPRSSDTQKGLGQGVVGAWMLVASVPGPRNTLSCELVARLELLGEASVVR